jgi:hypothetical protein
LTIAVLLQDHSFAVAYCSLLPSRFPMARTKKHRHAADVVDTVALAQATKFIATIFLGQGQYDKRECASLDNARIAADELSALHRSGRRPLIYAILPNGRQILVPAVLS